MRAHTNNQRAIAIFASIGILGVAVFLSVQSHVRWSRDYHFGEVVRVSGDDFLFRENDGGESLVSMDMYPSIKKGGSLTVEELRAGDKVVVIGSRTEDGLLKARFIRVVRDRRR